MTATVSTTTGPTTARPAVPGLIVPAVTTVVLFVASVIATVAFGDGLYSSPFASQPSDIAQTYASHETLIKVIGLLEFASALALVVFTSAVWTRLRAVAPGALTDVAAIGGILAALFMALNALVQWPLSYASVTSSASVRHALEFLYFGLGGFAHVASLGLLVGGVSLVALGLRLVPRWFAIAGLVLAAVSILSTLTFVVEGAAPLLPLGRFITFIWMIAVSVLFRATSGQRSPSVNT
jgi:hypothetical protein